MPVLKQWLTPARVRLLRIGAFTVLGTGGVLLVLLFIHIGLLPLIAWFVPGLENFFYDLAVFGSYRTEEFVSSNFSAPRGIVSLWDDRCDGGLVFLGPHGDSVSNPGPIIQDSQGELVWMTYEFGTVTNFRVHRYQGENYLTFWAGVKTGTQGAGAGFLLDSHYKVAHEVHAVGEGLKSDLHEFEITDQGTALITIYNTTTMDLRPMGWGRPKDGWVMDGIFQEIDIATNELLFQWRAQDYYKPEQSYYWHPFAGYVESMAFDFFHINSVQKDSKGNYLVGSRHYHTVTYVNGTSGDVIWILGGGPQTNQFNDLSGGGATSFQWQHHARWFSEEEGILSVLDNGIAGPLHVDAPYSKALLIQLDQEKLTAKLLHKYVSMTKAQAASQGSFEKLRNGNIFIGWGSAAANSEFTLDGTLLCESHFAASWSFWWERVKNYRAFKSHDWVGAPDSPPSAKIEDDSLFVSWNGATEVKFWELQGRRRHTDDSHENDEEFESIGIVEKERFETELPLPQDGEYVQYRVAAIDSEKQVLRFSNAVEPGTSSRSTIGVLLGLFAGVALAVGVCYCLRVWVRRRPSRRLFTWGDRYQYRKL